MAHSGQGSLPDSHAFEREHKKCRPQIIACERGVWQVHNEKWVSPYNGGAELAGCGGGEAAFAKKPAVESARVQVKACI